MKKQVGRERVSVIHGKKPVMFVAPHGPDDHNTAKLVEWVGNTDYYAVINNGFERADDVDVLKDKADCNRIDHVTEDVVKDEFLDPILKFVNLYKKFGKKPLIYYIHGFGNQVSQEAGEPVSCIIGYGEGNVYPSYTCSEHVRNSFLFYWQYYTGKKEVFYGKGGSKYAARHVHNMTQFYRKHLVDMDVNSLQVELSAEMRHSSNIANIGGILCQIATNTLRDKEGTHDDVISKGI